MDVTQFLGRNDVEGGIKMKQRHRHGDGCDDRAGEAGQPVGRPLFLLDIGFRLAQRFFGDNGI